MSIIFSKHCISCGFKNCEKCQLNACHVTSWFTGKGESSDIQLANGTTAFCNRIVNSIHACFTQPAQPYPIYVEWTRRFQMYQSIRREWETGTLHGNDKHTILVRSKHSTGTQYTIENIINPNIRDHLRHTNLHTCMQMKTCMWNLLHTISGVHGARRRYINYNHFENLPNASRQMPIFYKIQTSPYIFLKRHTFRVPSGGSKKDKKPPPPTWSLETNSGVRKVAWATMTAAATVVRDPMGVRPKITTKEITSMPRQVVLSLKALPLMTRGSVRIVNIYTHREAKARMSRMD